MGATNIAMVQMIVIDKNFQIIANISGRNVTVSPMMKLTIES